MILRLLLLCLLLSFQTFSQSYKKIHRKAIVVDTHNDILMKAADKGIVFDRDLIGATSSDLRSWKIGGLDVQLFSVYCDGDLKNPFAYANREIAFLEKHTLEYDSLIKSGINDFYAMDYLYKKYTDEGNLIRPPLSLLIQHIEYIINLVGIDYVGLGSDFDGINLNPLELDDVSAYPLITKALVEKGYSENDITKILGGNYLRVLKVNEEK